MLSLGEHHGLSLLTLGGARCPFVCLCAYVCLFTCEPTCLYNCCVCGQWGQLACGDQPPTSQAPQWPSDAAVVQNLRMVGGRGEPSDLGTLSVLRGSGDVASSGGFVFCPTKYGWAEGSGVVCDCGPEGAVLLGLGVGPVPCPPSGIRQGGDGGRPVGRNPALQPARCSTWQRQAGRGLAGPCVCCLGRWAVRTRSARLAESFAPWFQAGPFPWPVSMRCWASLGSRARRP